MFVQEFVLLYGATIRKLIGHLLQFRMEIVDLSRYGNAKSKSENFPSVLRLSRKKAEQRIIHQGKIRDRQMYYYADVLFTTHQSMLKKPREKVGK